MVPPTHPPSAVTILTARLLVLALAAVSVAGEVAFFDALYWHRLGWVEPADGAVGAPGLMVLVSDAVVSVIAAFVAASLAFRRERDRGSVALAVAVAAWAYLLAYGGTFRLLSPHVEGAFRVAFDAHFLLVECLGLAGLIRFSTTYPEPLTREDLASAAELPVGLRLPQMLRTVLLSPWAPWAGAVVLAGLVWTVARTLGSPILEAPLNPLMDLARFATLLAVVVNLRLSWDLRRGASRERLVWLVLGFSILAGCLTLLVGGNILQAVTGWNPAVSWQPVLLNAGLLGLLWSASMGVFYEGPMEPRALVRRTTIWMGLAAVLLFMSAGLEALLTGAVASRLSLPTGLGTMAAVCVFAWIYHPVRRLVETVVDQLGALALPEGRPATAA